MGCSCINSDGGFDLSIEVYDGKTLLIRDFSNWSIYDGKYEKPDVYEVMMFVPGYSTKTPFVLSLKTNDINRIKINDIMPSSQTKLWPDGIYCFKADVCDKIHTLNRGILSRSECCIMQYARTGNVEKLKLLQSLAESFKLAVVNNQIKAAMASLDILNTELSILNCNC